MTLFLFLPFPVMCSLCPTAAPYMFSFTIMIYLFCIDLFLSSVSLLTRGLCMVPIKGPTVPVPDDVIIASCIGTAFCTALQYTCLGLFRLLD